MNDIRLQVFSVTRFFPNSKSTRISPKPSKIDTTEVKFPFSVKWSFTVLLIVQVPTEWHFPLEVYITQLGRVQKPDFGTRGWDGITSFVNATELIKTRKNKIPEAILLITPSDVGPFSIGKRVIC